MKRFTLLLTLLALVSLFSAMPASAVTTHAATYTSFCANGFWDANTTYAFYGFGQINSPGCVNPDTGLGKPMSSAGALHDLVISMDAPCFSATPLTFLVIVNGSPTTLSCTTGTSKTCSDHTHTAMVNAGDFVEVHFTTTDLLTCPQEPQMSFEKN